MKALSTAFWAPAVMSFIAGESIQNLLTLHFLQNTALCSFTFPEKNIIHAKYANNSFLDD